MKTPFDPHATNLRTAAESGPRTLWMAADRIDDLSAKLATATAELETAKGRIAEVAETCANALKVAAAQAHHARLEVPFSDTYIAVPFEYVRVLAAYFETAIRTALSDATDQKPKESP